MTQRVITVRILGGQCEGGSQGETTSAGENGHGAQRERSGETASRAARLPAGQD